MPMDETITSFADRVIELFEMINLENGGGETLHNNTVVYKIPVEKPSPVKALTPSNEKNRLLNDELKTLVLENLLSGRRENMARAAYLAVCLDAYAAYAKKYPRQWKEACYHLSGYWKVMNNIFSKRHDFIELNKVQEKFANAGFQSPVSDYTNQELWNDKVVWKDPEGIYKSGK
jgi:hypothetical protein